MPDKKISLCSHIRVEGGTNSGARACEQIGKIGSFSKAKRKANGTMAEREDVTCSICMETFREPVMLPCEHTFCRECLGLYAEKCKLESNDETFCTAGREDVDQIISCPVCRSTTRLRREGVAGLPVNVKLAEIVERIAYDVKVGENSPCCSLCEEDNKAKAVKFCTNCGVLYCGECLTNYHPNRGPLKRHHLITSEEYVSQATLQDHVKTDVQSSHQSACARHGLAINMYCVPCRLVICVGCLTDHPEHPVRDIPSAAEKDKPSVLNKTSELEKVLQQAKEALSRSMMLNNKIQENQDLDNKEVEKAYNAALKDLDAWKLSSLDDINARCSQWSVQCGTTIKQLHIQIEEMEGMVQASKDLLSSQDVTFLQGCTDFTKAIDDQLTEKTGALAKHEVDRRKLSDSVQRDHVVPRRLIVKEMVQECHDVKATALEKHKVNREKLSSSVQRYLAVPRQMTVKDRHGMKAAVGGPLTSLRVTKPRLKFTKTSDGLLRITDEGSVVKGEDLSWPGCGAVTDGRFGAGRYYWELQITCSPGCACYCRVGVVQEGCGLWQDINPGSDSWYIMMAYRDDEVWCYSDCGDEIKPDYKQWRPHTGPHHLGLYLDCDQRSLIILDCGHKQVMATVRGLTVTQPLVPWVRFSLGQSASARLVTGDSTTLPQVLCDMLNTS